MSVDSAAGREASHPGMSEAEKTAVPEAAVREQVERVLANSHFSHSRRFPSFLRFVVEQTLAGQVDALKERTIGVEIFGRTADYDTAADPIVRVTAGEIRKRIAQYYQEPGHEAELRISLPSGSYVPQFHWPANPEQATRVETTAEHAAPVVGNKTPAKGHWPLIAVLCLLAAALTAGSVWMWQSAHREAFDYFWGSVLNSGDPVLFCVADQQQYSNIALRDSSDPGKQVILPDNLTAVVIDDLTPIAKIAGIMQANGKKYSLRGESTTSLLDLRAGPTIFIGAFDNAWTLRLTKPLRYHFGNDAAMTQFRIVDSNAPNANNWTVDRVQQMATNNYRDYAIVARFTDGTTGKLAVVAAGIGRGGTIAAGEFLTDPANLAQVMRAAKAAGNKKNLEIVLSTQIIGGEPGSPKMEAAYFW
jgi:hypothetical protein